MFSHDTIASLNELEFGVYNAVLAHREDVTHMTIRELADAAGASTTTVLRFCRKMQCEGYAEFKIRFKMYLEAQQQALPFQSGADEVLRFLQSINNDSFDKLIEQAVSQVVKAKNIIFVGVSSSASLGKYGARFFSNVGWFSHYIDDPYYPVQGGNYSDAVAIMLSVSGETPEILRLAREFKMQCCTIISITNSEHSSLAKIADLNISYHMPEVMVVGKYNITTQIPVLYILENIGRRLATLNVK